MGSGHRSGERLGAREREELLRETPQAEWEEFSCPPGTSCWWSRSHFLWGLSRGPQIMLVDDRECPVGKSGQGDGPLTPPTPVDLDLEWVLGKMPQKVCEPGLGRVCQWPSCHISFSWFVCQAFPGAYLRPLFYFRSSSSRGNPLCCSLWPCPQS